MRCATAAGSRPVGNFGVSPAIGWRESSVSVWPGRASMTRMPDRRTSRAATCTYAARADLTAEYAPMPLVGCSLTTPLSVSTKGSLPCSALSRREGSAARSILMGARALIAHSASIVSSAVSASAPKATAPAALTMPSSWPWAVTAVATRVRTAAGSVRSAGTSWPGMPRASRSVMERALKVRCAPASASWRARCRPRPPVAPTTRMEDPCRVVIVEG